MTVIQMTRPYPVTVPKHRKTRSAGWWICWYLEAIVAVLTMAILLDSLWR